MAHICMDYKAREGEVFVQKSTRYGYTWRRVKRAEAKDLKVLKCAICDKPAVWVDHHWPYMSDHNRCEDHEFTSKAG